MNPPWHWLPGWNSIDDAGKWSTFHFWAGIVALFALGAFEVLSHKYGERKEELVAAANKQEVSAAEERAKAASEQLSALRAHASGRSLSSEQRAAIIAAATPFKGQRISFLSAAGDAEGDKYKREIASALAEAGWSFEKSDVDTLALAMTAQGVGVLVNNQDVTNGTVPRGVDPLVLVLRDQGIIPKAEVETTANVPRGVITLVIGLRPLLSPTP